MTKIILYNSKKYKNNKSDRSMNININNCIVTRDFINLKVEILFRFVF